MTIDKQMILDKIKDNKRVIVEVIIAFFFLFSLYKNFTSYDSNENLKKQIIIQKIDEAISKNKEILKQIQLNIDSIHIEQKYIIEKIDGAQNSIKQLEKQRNEKIKYIYSNNVDSTINFLSDRYNKIKLPKDSLSK